MTEPQMNFGNFNVSGGIQNFGGTNTNTQHNHYGPGPREELDELLALLRESHPDRALAEREATVIEGEVRHPSVESRSRVDGALQRLATNSGNARTAAEAIAAIGALVAAHWPF